ncbi:YunG family protein [Sphingomonas glaciei]|uniref:Uncharacterized protein n=1 Tax=Sphingomonas glaciei TaxID=2938948 RepID=A0ABY5MVA6_9SPHN|nr:hypothetical protein [Sphingomonas glaciei]UUR07680.1 hypothetical protein M1K48_12205 [Sphingomonas glaciei]
MWFLFVTMNSGHPLPSMPQLQLALEKSWQPDTAYLGVHQVNNPALGQCYPTARLVQQFFPHFEIVAGRVDIDSSIEAHFWNIDFAQDPPKHIDLTWQQFPSLARVVEYVILDRHRLNDSASTIERCELLLQRVLSRLR